MPDEEKPKPLRPDGKPVVCIERRNGMMLCGRTPPESEFFFRDARHAVDFYSGAKSPIVACERCAAEFQRLEKSG